MKNPMYNSMRDLVSMYYYICSFLQINFYISWILRLWDLILLKNVLLRLLHSNNICDKIGIHAF